MKPDKTWTRRTAPRLLLLSAALALLPASAAAQDRSGDRDRPMLDFEVRSGASTPAGEFSHYAKPGYFTGLGLAYWVTEGLSVRVDGSLHGFDGAETSDRLTPMPDMRLWNGSLGLEYDWTRHDPDPVRLQTTVGVGATQLNSDFFDGPGGVLAETKESFTTFTAGFDVGVALTEDLRLVLGSKGYMGVLDEADLAALASVNAAAEPTDRVVTFSHSVGLRFMLPH